MSTQIVFRKPVDADELLKLLRLRYFVFRQSRLRGFVKEHPDQLDFDPWDKNSSHYGLFRTNDGVDQPIGYIRVVGVAPTPQMEMIQLLAARFPLICSALCREPEAPLPVLSYDDPNNAIWSAYDQIVQHGFSIVEPGRISLLSEYRTLAASKHIVESTMALGFFSSHPFDRALVSCARDHRTFYERYGFKFLPGSENTCQKVSWVLSALVAGPADVPLSIQRRTRKMAREYEMTGQILRTTSGSITPADICPMSSSVGILTAMTSRQAALVA